MSYVERLGMLHLFNAEEHRFLPFAQPTLFLRIWSYFDEAYVLAPYPIRRPNLT